MDRPCRSDRACVSRAHSTSRCASRSARPFSRHRLPGVAGSFVQESVAELRIVAVSVQQRAGTVRLDVFSVGDRIGPPTIVGLASELETRHVTATGIPLARAHSRAGKAFPGRFDCDGYAAARRSTSFSRSLIRRRASRNSAESPVVVTGLTPSSMSAWRSGRRKIVHEVVTEANCSAGTALTRGDPMNQLHSPGPSEHNPFTGKPINDRLLVIIPEGTAVLRLSRSSIYRLFKSDEFAWVQIGTSRRVTSAEIHHFIATHTQAAS